MKILYVITKSNWGGAQRHVFDIALNSKKIGHEVVVALGGDGMLSSRLKTEGITTVTIGSMKRDINVMNDASSFGDIFKLIRKEKPDILHLHSPKAAGLGSFAGRLLRIRQIIVTVHGWTFNENRPLHEKILIAFFSWLTMIFSTRTVLISEIEMSQALLFPFVSKKLRMIPLGINAPVFMSKSSTDIFIREKTGELPQTGRQQKTIVGTIAELHHNKGLTYAIEAMAKLVPHFPSILFLIIGEGEDRSALELLIAKKKLQKNVILAGYIENAAQYLKAFTIFLLPSLKEGLPYTLLEAGYAGLPVVATTVGGIPEIIDDMHSGVLIQPKKSDEIFHALEFLIRHKNVEREYAKNLQEKVKAQFNIEKMLEATEKLYSEAVK